MAFGEIDQHHKFLLSVEFLKVYVQKTFMQQNYFPTQMLQRDTLAPCLFVICLDYMLRTSIDIKEYNGFKLTKESWRYHTQTIKDVDYADDIELLANTHALAKTLLHSLKRAAAGIGLHVNAHKTEYMCFNRRAHISLLNGSSLKLVNKFT